jgi:ribosomal protein S18 acetylase RimI-like enzyme
MRRPEFTIRRAAKADAEALVSLWRKLVRHHEKLGDRTGLSPDAPRAWAKFLREHLRAKTSAVLVAESAGRLLGMGMASVRESPPTSASRRRGVITDLYVEPEWRRRGAGRALVAALLEHLRALGLAEADVTAASVNPEAALFWQKMGAVERRRVMTIDLSAAGGESGAAP